MRLLEEAAFFFLLNFAEYSHKDFLIGITIIYEAAFRIGTLLVIPTCRLKIILIKWIILLLSHV